MGRLAVPASDFVRILPSFHISPLLLVLSASLLAACGGAAAASVPLSGDNVSAQRAGAPAATLANCPVFPANNVWNTDISKLPVDKHNAAWMRSMDSSSTYLHPDFGPSGGYPYGIPYNVVTSAHRMVRVHFQYLTRSAMTPGSRAAGTRAATGTP
jgi:hypothetical protein